MDDLLALRLAGIAGIVGSLMYAIGDSLLLAVRPAPDRHPGLAAHANLLGGMERLSELDPARIIPGGFLGVFGTPLVILGWWLVYRGLAPAGELAAAVPALLFAVASVIGAFVHGWFMALADGVRMLDVAGPLDSPPGARALEIVTRARRILAIGYAPVAIAAIVASVWFSVVVLGGTTAFPIWVAAVNPVTLLIIFLFGRRVLPARIADPLEGTGFSVAYAAFFAVLTSTTWGGVPG